MLLRLCTPALDFVSDIAIFVLKRDVELQLTNSRTWWLRHAHMQNWDFISATWYNPTYQLRHYGHPMNHWWTKVIPLTHSHLAHRYCSHHLGLSTHQRWTMPYCSYVQTTLLFSPSELLAAPVYLGTPLCYINVVIIIIVITVNTSIIPAIWMDDFSDTSLA